MDGAEFDLPDCLGRVRDGDESAARALFRHFYPYVLTVVRAHLPARTDEEDLCQMTFVKAFSSLDHYSGSGSFAHWLSRIAVNTCLNQLRSERRRPEIRHADLGDRGEQILEELESKNSDLSGDAAGAARELVAQIMAELPPKERLLVTLLHLESRSVAEVAAMTGWNPAVVKIRAFRARRKMKSRLEKLRNECTR